MKRVVKPLIILLLAMTVSLPMAAQYYDDASGLYFDGQEGGGDAMVISPYSGHYQDNVVIPATIAYHGWQFLFTAVGDMAFNGATDLTGVTLPASIKTVGQGAFGACPNLATVTCLALRPPQLAADSFDDNTFQTASLRVARALVPIYRSDDNWGRFAHILPLDDVMAGDIDGSGALSIDDVVKLINAVLGRTDADINMTVADVDGDGRLSINDVTSLIEELLRSPKWLTFTVNDVTFKMVPVEGGTFMMGSQDTELLPAMDSGKPVHQVTLSSFYIGQTEVTQALWQAVMGDNPSAFQGNLQRPVEQVSWEDCQVFIQRLNELTGQEFKLPTEAQWEFAARGGIKSRDYVFAGSNQRDEVAWCWTTVPTHDEADPDYGTLPVACNKPNELGLYDMSGNVFEWCQDWYGTYSADDQINPTGPELAMQRVMRGGCWVVSSRYCYVWYRMFLLPDMCGLDTGLRLAL